mgnify:CR=1 FL=1
MGGALPTGVTASSGVEITPAISAFLTRLRATVHASIPLHITSGVRSPTAQADAMWKKLLAPGGEAEIRAIYPAAIAATVLNAPRSQAGWRVAITQLAASGVLASRHMRGDAFDMRTTNLSSSQVNAVAAAAKSLGASALVEHAPPHLHVQNVGGGGGGSWLPTLSVDRTAGWIVAGAFGAAFVIVLALRRRRNWSL